MATTYKPFKGNYPVTSGYGGRTDPISGAGAFHNGIDFGVPANTPLYNLEDGVVVVAGVIDNFNPKSPNLAVGVKADSDGVVAVCMHMNRIDVKVGQRLSGGQQIGLSGNTGYSTGAHLHFGLYSKLWNSTIDPTFLLSQWTEVGGNSTNNSNNMDLESQKTLARSFLETPEIQGLSFNDGNTFGYLRSIIDKPTQEGGQRPAESLKQFGLKALESERAKGAEINSLTTQLNDQKQVTASYQESLRVANMNVERLTAENTDLKNQLANQKPGVDIDINIYLNQIKELESKLATSGVALLAKDKEIESLKTATQSVSQPNGTTNEKFSFGKFFIGVSRTIREKNLVAYAVYVLAFVGIQVINYLSIQSQELGYSSLAVFIPLIREFFLKEQAKVTADLDPEIKKQIDAGLADIQAKLPKEPKKIQL